LSFQVADSALQKFVPAGWQSNPVSTGPSKGANVLLVLIDTLTMQGPDGKPGNASQGAVLVFPAKKTGTEATVPMVFAGFVSSASMFRDPTVPSSLPRRLLRGTPALIQRESRA